MNMATKKDYIKTIQIRYKQAKSRAEKTAIISEVEENLKVHRKHAIRVVNTPLKHRPKKTRLKKPKYHYALAKPLSQIWTVAGKPCSKRLKPMIPELITKLKQFNEIVLTPTDEILLSQIGTSTIDKLLNASRARIKKRGVSGTKSSPLLKHLIPVRTDFSEVNEPGHVELDCVLHCGETTKGRYAETLNLLDIHTHWNEKQIFLHKTKRKIVGSVHTLKKNFPFQLKSIDFDNGYEFVNWHLKKYCDQYELSYTRSRSYHKNDQAHIESKNFHSIRKVIGYARIESDEVVSAINDLYQNEHRLLTNFFYSTMKLKSREKINGKYKKQYERAQTPYQRVMDSKQVGLAVKMKLMGEYKKLNPAELQRGMTRKLSRIRELIWVTKLNWATPPESS